MKIALLSNATLDLLAGSLRAGFEVWTPPGFGAWAEISFDPPPDLLSFNPDAVFYILDPSCGTWDAATLERARESLAGALPRAEFFVVDVEAVESECAKPFRDVRMLQVAKMPWTLAGIAALHCETARLAAFVRGGAKKALAVDFDGTLWDGVLSEDGVDGVSPRRAFQEYLLSLERRGVILVGLSKNDPAVVEPVWRDPRMVLKREDFAAVACGWERKADNLAKIARELNIYAGDFVFVDDNPAERALMEALSPETAVPEFPATPDRLERFARMLTRFYFPPLRKTGEDASRTEQYRAEAARREAERVLGAAEYLRSLEIKIETRPAREEDFPRIARLLARTNQFNVLTVRRTVSEVAEIARNPANLALAVSARDRFGDYGTVAFANASVRGDCARIEDFAMSCRAMNRRIEYAIEEDLERRLAARGVAKILARIERTDRNAPVAGFFDSLGYARTGAELGAADYALDLPRKAPAPRHCVEIAAAD